MPVYFIQSERGGPVKIGMSKDPQKRLEQIQTNHPDRLRLLAVERGGKKEEAKLHERFGALRLKGEWFRPGPDLMRYIYRPQDDPSFVAFLSFFFESSFGMMRSIQLAAHTAGEDDVVESASKVVEWMVGKEERWAGCVRLAVDTWSGDPVCEGQDGVPNDDRVV